MADKKLNEVTKVTDMAYVPVILSDGSVGQIAKADLATVVAGVFSSLSLFPFMYRDSIGAYGNIKDYNNAELSGFYAMEGSLVDSNQPPMTKYYGVLLVVKAGDYKIQLAMSSETGEICLRGFVWGSWKEWNTL